MRLVYSTQKILKILQSEHDMDELEAIEYFDFNIKYNNPFNNFSFINI